CSNRLDRAIPAAHAYRCDECRPAKRRITGRKHMKQIAIAMAASALLFGTLAANAQAPSWTVPPESERCPSKWGAGDERGAGNHMKPQTVLNAVKLIKTAEVIELAHVLGPGLACCATRRLARHLKRAFMNPGTKERGSKEEMVLSEIGQVGAQFAGFPPQTPRTSHYNCFKTEEITTRAGFTKLGVQN